MLLPDVNVLVNAYRADAPDHRAYRAWLEALVDGEAAFGIADVVLSGALRILTHPRVFNPPNSLRDALGFLEAIRERDNCVRIAPGDRHWEIFTRLCRAAGAKGNHIPDAWLAALAIESGSEWITCDRGFARFPGPAMAPPALARDVTCAANLAAATSRSRRRTTA